MDTKDHTYEIPKEPTYHSEIRKFQNDDLLHADNVVNPVIQQVVENTAYNKKQLEEYETVLGTKVTKVEGKGLSTNDYTTVEKNKLSGLSNYDDTQLTNLVNSKVSSADFNNGLFTKMDKPKLLGHDDTAFGDYALSQSVSGSYGNVAIGTRALSKSNKSTYTVAIGRYSLNNIENTHETVAIGSSSLSNLVEGSNNVAVGSSALQTCKNGSNNVAVGKGALYRLQNGSDLTSANNCIGLGGDTRVSGDNQLQLGNSTHTVYSPGAIQNRSDARDKADIQDTELGLDFIKGIRPVEFRWDYRDDYFEEVEKKDGTTELKKIPKDGSKKRKRLHQGFIAQEVKQVIDNLNVDFGGYQDHSINGGCDVLSLGYEEFIAPMVKAIQEQQFLIEQLQEQVKLLGGKTNGRKL